MFKMCVIKTEFIIPKISSLPVYLHINLINYKNNSFFKRLQSTYEIISSLISNYILIPMAIASINWDVHCVVLW